MDIESAIEAVKDHTYDRTREVICALAAEVENLRYENKQLRFDIESNACGKCWRNGPEVETLQAKVRELEEENKALHGEGLTIYAFMGNEANKELKQRYAELVKACEAVIERWDTPLWKDVPATAVFINALRTALQNIKEAGG